MSELSLEHRTIPKDDLALEETSASEREREARSITHFPMLLIRFPFARVFRPAGIEERPLAMAKAIDEISLVVISQGVLRFFCSNDVPNVSAMTVLIESLAYRPPSEGITNLHAMLPLSRVLAVAIAPREDAKSMPLAVDPHAFVEIARRVLPSTSAEWDIADEVTRVVVLPVTIELQGSLAVHVTHVPFAFVRH